MDAKKNALRTEDIAKGVFVPVSHLLKKEPKKVDLRMAADQWQRSGHHASVRFHYCRLECFLAAIKINIEPKNSSASLKAVFFM